MKTAASAIMACHAGAPETAATAAAGSAASPADLAAAFLGPFAGPSAAPSRAATAAATFVSAKWLAHVGDWAYETTLKVNRHLNALRARLGLPY